MKDAPKEDKSKKKGPSYKLKSDIEMTMDIQ